jgi:hypothetical protein
MVGGIVSNAVITKTGKKLLKLRHYVRLWRGASLRFDGRTMLVLAGS